MSVLGTQISYYLRIAIDINKKVGGTRGYEAEQNAKDKFTLLRDNINKDFHFVKTRLEDRPKKKGTELLRVNLQIKEKMEEVQNQLDRMNEILSADTSEEASKEIKGQIIEQLRKQAKNLQELIENSSDSGRSFKPINTLTDNRAVLLDHEGKSKQTHRVKRNKNNQDPTEIELEAMDRWKKRDEQIEDGLDQVIDRTKEWNKRLKETGEKLDETDAKIQALTDEADKVNDDLLRSNKQLKGIVEKYRKPHKFCIDIVLVLILVGIVVAIIKIAQ